jgi:hypothetical protein
MNMQNTHILEKLTAAQEATKTLVQAGLTVTHIHVEGVFPRISILSGPQRKNKLPISWKVIRQTPKGREVEMAACVNGCEIRWLENA